MCGSALAIPCQSATAEFECGHLLLTSEKVGLKLPLIHEPDQGMRCRMGGPFFVDTFI